MANFVADAQVHGHSITGDWRKGIMPSWLFFIPLISCLLSPLSSLAQDTKARELYAQSIKLFGERKANEAIPFMEQAVKQDPNFADAHLKLGQLYEFTKRFDPALDAYRAAIRLQPDSPASGAAYQSLSSTLLRLGRYSEALPYLEKFQTLFPPKSVQNQRIGRQIETARFGQEALLHPQPVDPKPLSTVLQTTPSQYFPVLTPDEQTLVFTALKPEGDEDLMIATYNGESWSPPISLSSGINTNDNEGTASLSADGRLIVFTACQGRKGYGSCDLYLSRKTGSDWSTPENLGPTVNTHHYESQPSLSADGRRLYFVSDRPGGKGRRDIWRSDLDEAGTWSKPLNIGGPVNTPFNEASPFIHANGQSLFFASDGHVGLGGYDLFVADSLASTGQNTGWSTPTNLGYPINTSEDQASLFVAANGTRAYYSFEEQKEGVSQRSRLYVFDLPESLRERVKPVSFLKGIVADSRSKKPLPAMVELIDLKTNQVVSRVQTDATTGQYTAVLPSGGDYALYVSAPGYLFKSLSFDFSQPAPADRNRSSGTGIAMNVPLERAVSGTTAKETLNNLFFESTRYDLADKSRTELDRISAFMKTNPTIRIEIAGHTDDRGDPAANLLLSQKRAQAVVNYLTKAGVEPGRMQAVGFGKTRPAVPNSSDENRQLNRRIEWRIL
ncbi:OmpA family protein [Spirosoma utsteinense]|uniref:Outer membrane protein OmpA-like peptidoglycan-associated protein n=1 Tax=Spirosoma utsteinense TaxID=2585773 RepID=A0ABR6W8K2_9BACT|nr:OmpA family protein [Spirosoma utsteinense]MBC3787217.1 outer membrane protein OmpA-like peptidoglycan-associated protein [Spirosoma utsteinense]MBC3792903.1 outer membrane protein OmpA-like peptidoglycan-associated protein [Spirosoma utsteinense]